MNVMAVLPLTTNWRFLERGALNKNKYVVMLWLFSVE
jgi:hypothetical protein